MWDLSFKPSQGIQADAEAKEGLDCAYLVSGQSHPRIQCRRGRGLSMNTGNREVHDGRAWAVWWVERLVQETSLMLS